MRQPNHRTQGGRDGAMLGLCQVDRAGGLALVDLSREDEMLMDRAERPWRIRILGRLEHHLETTEILALFAEDRDDVVRRAGGEETGTRSEGFAPRPSGSPPIRIASP